MTTDATIRVKLLSGGVLIGMAAVSFPSLGNVFKDPLQYALTDLQYGLLFVVQSVAAVMASLLSSKLTIHYSSQVLLRTALLAACIAMIILSMSTAIPTEHWAKYGSLLAANLCAGIGVGLGIAILNVSAAAAWPESSLKGVSALHAMIGAGLAVGPLVVSGALVAGDWWYGTSLIAGLLMALSLWHNGNPTVGLVTSPKAITLSPIPGEIYLFGILAFLYGVVEATFSNWCVIYLHLEIALPAAQAGIALTLFWSAVTVGRLGYFGLPNDRLRKVAALTAPFAMSVACFAVALAGGPVTGIGAFGLAGLGCACFYPAILGGATSASHANRQFISGMMVSTVLLGTGAGTHLTAFWLDLFDLSLNHVYMITAVIPVIIALLAYPAMRRISLQR